MKLAVLSDIHGNYEALKACVDYMEKNKVDGYIFLGDYVGELPNPEMTIGLIRGLMIRKPCYVIKGNKEEYIEKELGGNHPEWDDYPSVVGMLRYGYDHISGSEKDFLKSLPITMRVETEGLPALRICHGSPTSTKGEVKKEDEAYYKYIEEEYVLCGHTHVASAVHKYGKKVWNPGAVGLPLCGECVAQCMILYGENGEWRPDYIEVPYDVDVEIEHMKRANLFKKAPFWSVVTVDLLKGGSVSHGAVLSYAMNLCKKETGECVWPKVPEKYMERAVNTLVFLD